MRMPDQDQVHSFLRHVYTAAGTATAVAVAFGLSDTDSATIRDAVHQIGDGVASIVAGVAALVPFISGAVAALSASRPNRLRKLDADPQIALIKTVPGTDAAREAAAIPGNKVT
jgi:hypothetical protein